MNKFTMYNSNGKGTGSALSMEIHPSTVDRNGHLTLTIAPQKTVGDARGPNPTFPTFDFGAGVSVDVDFDGICQILQVFRGEIESINDGRGMCYRTATHNTIVKFEHQVETVSGYFLKIGCCTSSGEVVWLHHFVSPAVALGITLALESAMHLVVFGSPNDDGSSIADVMKKIADA